MSADGTAMAVWLQAGSEGCFISDMDDGRCPGLVWANRYVPLEGWGSPVLIGELGPSDEYVTYPRIAMDARGRAVVLWANDTLWANHFTPGLGWATPSASPWDPSPRSLQVLLDRGGVAVMVWWGRGTREQSGPIAWAGHYVPAQGWGEPVLLASNAMRPRIAADEEGSAILAVWQQGESNVDGYWRSLSIGASRFTQESGWGDPTVYQLPEGEVYNDIFTGVAVALALDGTAVVTWTRYVRHDTWTVWAASLTADMAWSKGFELEKPGQAAVDLFVDGAGTATVLHTYWGCGYGGSHPFWVSRFVPGNGWETPSLATDAGVCYGVGIVGNPAGGATVVWGAGTSAVWGLQYAADRGWGTPTRISVEGNSTWWPVIASNPASGEVMMVWTQWTGGGAAWDPSDVNKRRIYASQFRPLTLSSPQDGEVTFGATVTVAGWAWPGATLAVNGIQAAVAADGTFSFLLTLEEGTNTIMVVATDSQGTTRTLSVQVTYLNPVHSLEQTLRETNDALADAKRDLRETNDALAEARSGLAGASQTLFLMFVLQFALAASIALLFVLYWQQRRGGPGVGLGFSRTSKAATSSIPSRGRKSHSVTVNRTHRPTGQPEEGNPWPKTPAGSPLHLTIKDRIALHLLDHTRHAEAAVVPPELTQEGIAEAAGFNRRHFAQNVRPLVREGLVEERMAHVEGALQRQKVYSLTYEGWKRTLGVRNRIISVIVPLHDNRGVSEVSIEEILGHAHGSKSLLDVVRESAEGESWKPDRGG